MLYDIFIYPIEYVLKLIFETSYHYTDSYIMATIILSILVSTVLLPFYYWADKLQAKERVITQKLKPTIDEFKSVYSGSKLHAVTNTLYRQNNYHPIYSLRSVMGLLVQVPFFIAAYHFLSTYQPIVGVETWLFKDLGTSDGWLHIGSLYINVMPFIMTAVNLVSGFVFTRGMTKSEETQIWILAVVFLVLLYASPALLVLYWTMNNVFSLLMNIVKKKFKLGPLFSRTFTKETISFRSIKNVSLVEISFVMLVLYVYLLGITHIAPEGINRLFAIKLKEVIPYILLSIILLIGISSFVFNNIKSYRLHNLEVSKKSDYLLILLPLTPIIQYVILNQDTLTMYGSIYIVLIAVMISIVFIISLPILLSLFSSRTLFMSLGLALLTILFYMPLLAIEYSWDTGGSRKIQWSLLIVIFLISYIGYIKKDKILKVAIIILFISNSISISLPYIQDVQKKNLEALKTESKRKIESKKIIVEKIKISNFSMKPNIFLLVYDAYPDRETMKKYNIDNEKQEKYLENIGFKIYNGIYSIGGASLPSMSTMLDMSKAVLFGKSIREYTRYMISGHTNVYSILKSQGYNLAAMFPTSYMFGKNKPVLDNTYPESMDKGYKILWQSILMGKFSSTANIMFTKTNYNSFVEKKRVYMGSNLHPKFLYTHTHLPGHSPTVTKCRENEIEKFSNRLYRANIEMKKDIETIQKNNPNAIIIIAGDHGPYITGNCLMYNGFESIDTVKRINIQDAFGVFLAIKWPKSIIPIDSNISILQDVFPSVFATLLEDKTIFNKLKISPNTNDIRNAIAGVRVENGIIIGGENDGEPLFLKE